VVIENQRHFAWLDGKLELNGGSKEDRIAAREWMSLFWHEEVMVGVEPRSRSKQTSRIKRIAGWICMPQNANGWLVE
jgi:hypothetical protein